MNYLVILFGIATILAGIVLVVNPETVFGLLRRKSDALGLHILAVVVRLFLGAALVWCATASKYPTAILIIGWFTIIAGVVLGIMGRDKFIRLMSWILGFSSVYARMGGIAAILIGGFLVHAIA